MDSTHREFSIKGGKVRKSHMEKLVLDPPPETAEEIIKEAFKDLIAPESPPQQVGAVEKLVVTASGSEASARVCCTLLVSSLLQLKPKVQLRNKILKSLPSIGNSYPQLYRESVMTVLNCALTQTSDPIVLMQGVSLVVEGAGTLFCKFQKQEDAGSCCDETKEETYSKEAILELQPRIIQAMLQGITLLWNKNFKESSSSVEACVVLQQIQQLMKSSTMYFQQYYSGPVQTTVVSQDMHELLEAVLKVVQHPSCPLDLRINCGQLFVVIHNVISQGRLCHLVQLIVNGDEQYCDLARVAQLALINGVLCITHGKDLYIKHDDTCLGVQVLQAVLTSASQSNDGNVAVSMIRVVFQWTLRTQEALQSPLAVGDLKNVLNLRCPVLTSLLDYLWLAWDHFLDSVKHTTKESFMNLIKIMQGIDFESSKHYFLNICKMFLNQLSSRKYRCSAVSCMVPVVGAQTLLELYPNLPNELLNYMKDPAMASHAAELLEALFKQHVKEVSSVVWQNVWLTIFIDSFSKEMQVFGYELLFKKLLFTCPESLDIAVARLVQCSVDPVSEKLCLLIMCVKIGRYSSHWLKTCQSRYDENDSSMWRCILPYRTIKLCLSHKEESVRIAAFSLLCESPKSTELLEKHELDLILDYYIYSMPSQSPSYRQQLVKSTKKLFQRIKDGSGALIKSGKNKENECLTNTTISEQSLFCTKLFSLMAESLNCGANMVRRSTALTILQMFHDIILQDCGKIFHINQLSNDEVYIDTLLCVLNDSFECNKIIALNILCSVVEENWGIEQHMKICSLVKAASSFASSCRPPDSLTSAYVFKFLCKQPAAVKMVKERLMQEYNFENPREVLCRYILESLKKEVQTAQESLLMAAASGPMYGLLLCLKMLISDISESELTTCHGLWVHLIQEVLKICYTISDLVAPVVRNSSPEGHLPMDLNPESLATLRATLQASLGNQQFQEGEFILSQESESDELVKAQAVSAQMLLLCAWRCVKEISLILGDLIQQVPLSPDALAVLTVEDVTTIGQFFLTQLSETKHRGAFEQSYIGFGRVCDRLWRCEEEQLRKLPEEWLRDVLNSIQNYSDTRLCATRRSAGVPFVVQAVLSSEPSVRGAVCLKSTMTTLLTLAEKCQSDGTDSRIHAFNILRAVYRDTRLGDLVIPYVSTGVKAAIRGYKSTSWAERNSAALLFASLVTRMLGVKQTQDDLSRKNAMSALVFFRRYPELFDFLKDELEVGAEGVKEKKLVPALFPTLLLLARLSPAPLEGRTSAVSLSFFTPAVLQCAASSVLQLRALASHALIPLVPPSHLCQVVNQLCMGVCLTDQNKLHGSLLCLLKLLKNYSGSITSDNEKSAIIMNVISISWVATEKNSCLVTRGCALELFTFMCSEHFILEISPVLEPIRSGALSLIHSNDPTLPNKPWSALCQRQAALFLIQSTSCPFEDSNELNMIKTLLSCECYEVRLAVLEHIADFQNPPEFIIKQLMDRVRDGEIHTECLILIYDILSKAFHPQEIHSELIERNQLGLLLQLIISKTKGEPHVELIPAVLQFSSAVVITLLSLKPIYHFEDAFNQWLEMILNYSSSEHSLDSRLMVAEGIAGLMPFLSFHPNISESAKLELFETVVMLLQDDWDVVRDTIAKGVERLLAWHHDQPQLSLQSTRMLPQICDVISNIRTPEALSLLVKLILKEDLPQDFGLTQDDDRVFDKGEMNVYSEDITVGRTAARSLACTLSSWPSGFSPPVFLKSQIEPLLCIFSSTQKNDNLMKMQIENKEGTFLSISSFLNLLEQDINFIFQQISASSDRALYCVKNIDTWLVRLGCRSALWRSLTQHYHTDSSVVSSVVTALKNSIIKGKFLSQILDELS
ncbi:thyroid adenoma-associated protein-like [Homarus americanus]|uniref:Thyroid adenoma-associated protein-like 3 n=1 Tax=Homarus americanus TaxID=6706 RepID=A0A8J5TVA8_HOMAM|nr:thyroid adenoma-associated protein-like [Homarus americanus]KAG7177843.1 Thyroid adenoma-associated protein-like 3 [Homarus americanus]